jgi:hypothetical protein
MDNGDTDRDGQQNVNSDLLKIVKKFFNVTEDDDADCNPYMSSSISCEYIDEYAFSKKYSSCNKFKILSLNVQSIHAKFSDLSSLIELLEAEKCSPDVICIQETWQIRNVDVISLPGYQNIIFKSRSNNVQGGGVGFYVKNGLSVSVLNDVSIFRDRIFKSMFIKVSFDSKEHVIGNIYRPNVPFGQFSSNDLMSLFNENLLERSGDISGRTTAILQFSSELEQTWHSYY